jgi:diamine N-acetyltransferase
MVELVPITRDNWRASLEIRVQPERLQWVASREPVALMVLAKSYVEMDGQKWHPLLIAVDGKDVGVVAVGTGGDVAWVHHFLIDERQQGRGYGRAAMRAIGEWLRTQFPDVTRIGLDVLPENTVAFALYSSLGFARVGNTLDDQWITMTWLDDLLR